jgi:hypothetical protein
VTTAEATQAVLPIFNEAMRDYTTEKVVTSSDFMRKNSELNFLTTGE